MARRYFVTKVEQLTDDGTFIVTAKAKNDDPTKGARSVIQAPTKTPMDWMLGEEVIPSFVRPEKPTN